MPAREKISEIETKPESSLQEELRQLDTDTFEIEDYTELTQDAASSSTASCSCCSTSCSSCVSC